MKVSLNPEELPVLLSLFAGCLQPYCLIFLIVCFMSEIDFEVKPASQLFTPPVPLDSKPARKACVVQVTTDPDSGSSVVERRFIEDEMSKVIHLNFQEQLLSSLVAHGIEPHALDMIDVSRIGIDRDVDALASHIVSHIDDYVISKD